MSRGRRGVCSSSGLWCCTILPIAQLPFYIQTPQTKRLSGLLEILAGGRQGKNLLGGVNYSLFMCKSRTPASFSLEVVWGKTNFAWDDVEPVLLPARGHVTRQDGRLHTYFKQDFYNTRQEGNVLSVLCGVMDHLDVSLAPFAKPTLIPKLVI